MAVIVLNDESFETEVLKAENTVLVDFFATWCGPCKRMLPIMDELANENPKLKFCKIDVDKSPKLAEKYGVMGVPCFIFFKGGKVVKELAGMQAKDKLLSEFKNA